MPGPSPNKNNNPNHPQSHSAPRGGGNNTHPQSHSAPRGSQTTTPPTSDKPHYPLPKTYPTVPGGEFGNNRGDHIHQGIDLGCPVGTDVLAAKDGKLTRREDPPGYGHYITIDHANNERTIYGHLSEYKIASGETVKKGDVIALSGGAAGAPGSGDSTGPHLHFQVEKNGTPIDPAPWLDGATTGAGTPGGNPGSTATAADLGALAKSTAFSTFLNFPGIMNNEVSLALKGERSLMNDEKLFPFVQQLCEASLRSFQSLPNGAFFAFFPDYFGGLNHRTAYWSISDLETIDATMELSDDALATHVYVVGDNNVTYNIDKIDMMQSSGVVTLFTAFQADFLSGAPVGASKVSGTDSKKSDTKVPDSMIQKDQAISFLQKYGARPHYEAAPMVQSPYFEAFLAYQRFMLLWSKQFVTTFTFTYMPELFPGGIIEFEAHGIQCYIDEVEHTCDYAEGFVTRAVLSAPAAIGKRDASGNIVRSGRTGAHEGMIRAGAIGRPTGTGA